MSLRLTSGFRAFKADSTCPCYNLVVPDGSTQLPFPSRHRVDVMLSRAGTSKCGKASMLTRSSMPIGEIERRSTDKRSILNESMVRQSRENKER